MIYYTVATERHFRQVVPFLRSIDIEECEKIHGIPISFGLLGAMRRAHECYTVLDGQAPLAIFGVNAGTCADEYTPWLVGTPRFTDHWTTVARESRRLWDQFRWKYGRLTNVLLRSNHVHRRWLDWLGVEWEDVRGRPDCVRFYSCVSP